MVFAAALVAALALPLVAAGAIIWRRALVMALPFLAVLNGLAIPIGAGSLRADQLAACLLAIPLATQLARGTRLPRLDTTAWCLAALFVLNAVASGLHSPAPTYSLLQCANLASVWIIYVLLLNFLDTPGEVSAFWR